MQITIVLEQNQMQQSDYMQTEPDNLLFQNQIQYTHAHIHNQKHTKIESKTKIPENLLSF